MIEGQEVRRKKGPLRYAMAGGGAGAFIGDVHRKSIAMDGAAEIAAGCFSQSFQNTLSTGDSLGISRDRLYASPEEMIRAEAGRPDRIDFIVVVTPNNSHYPISRLALESGFDVVCEKPMTTSVRDAEELGRLAAAENLFLCVAYAYSGYPMVKHVREMVSLGELGEIRFISAEYPQDWLATPLEKTGQKQAVWRADPEFAGISNCVADIGSHIENVVSRITGLEIESLLARLDRFGDGRVLDDNASIMVNYRGGARGLFWSSQIAVGHDNGLRVGIYGSKASVEWLQEHPDQVRISYVDKPTETISRGRDKLHPRAQAFSRLPSGHPEGYFECFANLYSAFLGALGKRNSGEALSADDLDFPNAGDGIRGVRFIEKCVESSENGAVWVDF